MPDYREMYFQLTAQIANAIDTLDDVSEKLKQAQRNAEESYISCDIPPLLTLHKDL